MSGCRSLLVALIGALSVPAASADGGVATALSARWMSAYNSGDLKELAAVYAVDARVQHGYCAPVHGREAIEDFWEGDVGEPGTQTSLEVVDSFQSADVVYVSGTYAVREPEATDTPIGGKFIQIWRRNGSSDWLLFRESWVNLACIKVDAGSEPPPLAVRNLDL